MNCILLIYGDEAETAGWSDADWQACYAAHQRYGAELESAGVLRGGAELKPAASARCVRFVGDAPGATTEGPFAAARESLGGFYLIEVDSMAEALRWAERMPCMQGGAVEVRELGMA